MCLLRNLSDTVTATMTASISTVTADREPRSSLRDMEIYKLEEKQPDWDNLAHVVESKAKQIRYHLPESVDDILKERVHLEELQTTVTLKMCRWAFAAGSMRFAVLAMDGHGTKRVVKMFKNVGDRANSKKSYLSDMQTQTMAATFASAFNDLKLPGVPKLSFLVAKFLSFHGDSPFYTALETFVESKIAFVSPSWLCSIRSLTWFDVCAFSLIFRSPLYMCRRGKLCQVQQQRGLPGPFSVSVLVTRSTSSCKPSPTGPGIDPETPCWSVICKATWMTRRARCY